MMSPSIGVLEGILLLTTPLKRAALVFDQIFILDAKLLAPFLPEDERAIVFPELEWLAEQGVVQLLDSMDELRKIGELKKRQPTILNEQDSVDLQNYLLHYQHTTIPRQQSRKNEPDPHKRVSSGASIIEESSEYRMRIFSLLLRATQQIRATPVLTNSLHSLESLNPSIQGRQTDVINVVIKALPVPDDSTAWEQIIDFRNDQDARDKFSDLRKWMRAMAHAELPPAELEEELEDLIHAYERQMKLHRMKINTSTFEAVVTTISPTTIFKWDQITKALFALRHRPIDLLIAESQSSGYEIAYIIQARKEFGQ